uniref:Uncharacterized protein n=2 Tax=Colletotrichum fructicola (strain Nara gc5) TaxID=1213859 RepID=L2FJ85_COLFN
MLEAQELLLVAHMLHFIISVMNLVIICFIIIVVKKVASGHEHVPNGNELPDGEAPGDTPPQSGGLGGDVATSAASDNTRRHEEQADVPQMVNESSSNTDTNLAVAALEQVSEPSNSLPDQGHSSGLGPLETNRTRQRVINVEAPRAGRQPLVDILWTPDLVDVNLDCFFSDEEKQSRDTFTKLIRKYQHDILTSRTGKLPHITVKLAHIQSRAKALEGLDVHGEVRILIVGLRTKKSRRQFHTFWMRPENKHYVPFKLCYAPETGAIFPAAVATCALKEIRDTTLCGRLIVIRSSNLGPRTSTVGGLLKIEDQFFALTTSHMPEDSDQMLENDNKRMTEKHSGTVLVFDDEAFERDWNDLDEALLSNSDDEVDDSDTQAGDPHVLDDDGDEREEVGRDSSHDMTIDGDYVMFQVNEERMRAGEDWQLVPVDLEYLLPNKIPERSHMGPSWENPYIEDFCNELSGLFKNNLPRKVWVISGMGDFRSCWMCPNSSQMISPDGTEREVWTLEFDQQDLKAGDSGSWVVDHTHRQLLGIVVARSLGVGYIVSFARRGSRRSVQVDVPRERYNVENLNVANSRVHSGQYLDYVIPIAVCYMAFVLSMNFGREYSPRSQLLGQVLALPILESGLWVISEVYFYCRTTTPERQNIREHFRQAFYDSFLVVVIAACLGASGAHLARSYFPSVILRIPETPDITRVLRAVRKMIHDIIKAMKTIDTLTKEIDRAVKNAKSILPSGYDIHDWYQRLLDRIEEVLYGIRQRIYRYLNIFNIV